MVLHQLRCVERPRKVLMHTKLWCPRCDSFRTPKEVDFESIPVRCVLCGTAVEVDDGKPEAEALPKRRRIPAPDHFSVEFIGSSLRISYPPRALHGFGIALFFAVVFVCTGITLDSLRMNNTNRPAILCTTLLIAIGGAVLALSGKLSGRLVRTVIMVGGGRLDIQHNPLPWLGGRSIDTDRISQLYAATGRQVTGANTRTTYQTYQLWAIVDGYERVRLLDGLGTLHEAAYLEQTIEEHLRITDRPVPGGISL